MAIRIHFFSLLVALLLCGSTIQAQNVVWSQKANPDNLSLNSVAFRSDGQQVLTGTNCHPAAIRIFETANGNLTWDYNVGFTYMCIMGVAFSNNSNYIAAVEEFGNIFLFDNTGTLPQILDTINVGTTYGFAIAISPNSDQMAVGLSNGRLKLFDLPGGNLVQDIGAHPTWVTTVDYTPDGTKMVTGGSEGKVKIWSNTGTLLYTCSGHTGKITQVRVTPDGQYIVSSGVDNRIRIWDIATGTLVRLLTGHADDVMGIDISPDGSRIVSGCNDGDCKIWDFANGSVISTFGIPDSGSVNTVAWSPDGNYIATGNMVSDLVVWTDLPLVGTTEADLASGIHLSPNPADHSILLQTDHTFIHPELTIFNQLGQQMVRFSPSMGNRWEIETETLPSGIYWLQLQDGSQRKVTQFIVHH